MASTFTPNIQWEQPARGDDIGTWDGPVNNNGTLIDLITGANATIGLNNSNVVLSAAQFRSKQITLNSTLTGSVTLTFPTSFTKSYEMQNLCTGSSAFVITLATTAAGGQVICLPPGETVDCFNDGTNIKFKNFGRIGEYWDYAGSSNPAWNTGCTMPPYLNCDGTAIPVAYTVLPIILGSSLLPDSRGRFRAALNQTTGRLTSSQGGVDGNTLLAAGSSQTSTLVTANLPPYTPSGALSIQVQLFNANANGLGIIGGNTPAFGTNTAATFTGTAQGGTSTPFSNVPPAYIGGLTLIRAA